MRKFTFSLAFLMCFFHLLAFSQQKNISNSGTIKPTSFTHTKQTGNSTKPAPVSKFQLPSNNPDKCATMPMDDLRRSQNPGMESLNDFENWLGQKIAESSTRAAVLLTIPVVVHVIHNNTESVGQGRNISAAQVQSQITVLNQDFRRLLGSPGYNSHVDGADIEIEFCMAQIDPSGNTMAEAGINRVNRNSAGFTAPPYTTSYIDGTIKPATYWDPNLYMNIWVCEISGGILGYAQFPSSSGLAGMPSNGGSANTDGVVAGYKYFGSSDLGSFPVLQAPYDKGRTTTHEVGHWLGLRHIWGDGGCSVDDYCSDTPLAGQSNFGCPSGTNSCSGGANDMIENYMDYTDDPCMNIFTNNQKTRMRTVMDNSPRRVTLPSSTVCNPTAAPVADFVANITTVTVGGYVSFTDLSTGAPTSWSWNMGNGGTPNTSTAQNPIIQFNTIGTYTITLTATNGNGSDTETKNLYINVVSSAGCDTLSNYLPGDSLRIYYAGSAANGYLAGHNIYEDAAKADFFGNPAPFNNVTGGLFYFGYAYSTNPGAYITATVWDATGTGSSPGTVLGTKNILISDIAADVAGNYLTEVIFNSPIPISGDFYMGFQMTYSPVGDTVALVTTQVGNPNPNTAWEKWSAGNGGAWYPYSSTSSWNVNLSHLILPYVTDVPPTAAFTATPTTVCEGSTVTYNSSTSLNAVSYSWSFPGGTPSTSVSANPSVIYSSSGTYDATLVVYGACSARDTLVQTNFITVTTGPNITISSTNITCNGANDGSATANVTGGTSPYTYAWSNGATTSSITGLSSGNYTITVNDNVGCTDVVSVNITEPGILTATTTVLDAACTSATGSITANTSGGTAPFTYSWNTTPVQTTQTASGLPAGTYSVNITDANGCTTSASGTINSVNTLSATTSVVDESCGNANGTATANPMGGSSPYSYSWNTTPVQTTQTAIGLTAGTYSVTITDVNGCTASTTDTVNNTGSLSLTTSTVNETCGSANGSATAIPGGSAPYTYSWSTSPVQTTQTATNLAAGTYSVTVTDGTGCTATTSVIITNTPGATVSATGNNVTCNGTCDGSATALATGGASPYTYLWSNSATTSSISALCAGLYTVLTTDANGCQDTTTVAINQPAAIALNTSSTNETCNGANGSATVTASGGAGSFTYSWNTNPVQTSSTASGLSAGTYTATVTDVNGCVQTTSISIINVGNTAATVTPNQTICAGQSAMLTANATGGTSPYTYSWSTGASSSSITVTPSSTTTYTVIATDANGCSATSTTTVTVTPIPNTTVTPSQTVCGGQPFTLTASGGVTYFWSTGATTASIVVSPTSNTTYSVIAINGNCSDPSPATVTLTVEPSPTANASSDVAVTYLSLGATVNFSNTGSVYTSLSWAFGDGGTAITSNPSYTYTSVGIYNAVLTTVLGNCTATDTVTIEVLEQVGITANTPVENEVLIYPNPSSGKINIDFNSIPTANVEIRVFNNIGELIVDLNSVLFTGQNCLVDLSGKADGIYYISIATKDEFIVKKVAVLK